MTLSTKVNLVASRLSNIVRVLQDAERGNITKAEMRDHIASAKKAVYENAKELDGYRNVLNPIVAGAEENTVTDELQKIKEDIGTAIYKLHCGSPQEAEGILIDIQERL